MTESDDQRAAGQPARREASRTRIVTGRSGLRVRLIAWFVLLAVLVFAGATAVTVRLMRAELTSRVDAELEHAVQRIERSLEDAAPLDATDALAAAIEDQPAFDGEVIGAVVGGDPLASTGDPALLGALADGGPLAPGSIEGSRGLTSASFADQQLRALTVPVVVGGEGGAIVVARTTDLRVASAGVVATRLGVAGALVLAAFSVLAWATITRTLRPVHLLSRAVRRTSDDELGDRLDVIGDDDVADLARTFNDMLDRLESGIRARETHAEHLQHVANHDPLTRVKNRLAFHRALGRAGEPTHGDLHALLVLDLDGFKGVNDSLGHHAGDEVLVEVARRIEALTRPMDTFARLGGDEFALLCIGLADASEAVDIGRRICDAVAMPIVLGDHVIGVGASVGVAVGGDHDIADLLPMADAAMYEAKVARKGVVMWRVGVGER